MEMTQCRKKLLQAIGLAMMLAGCASNGPGSVDPTASRVYSVQEVAENRYRLDGKRIRVRGFVGNFGIVPFCDDTSTVSEKSVLLTYLGNKEVFDSIRQEWESYRGHMMVVEGNFENSRSPLSRLDFDLEMDSDDYLIGPLEGAVIIEVFPETCQKLR